MHAEQYIEWLILLAVIFDRLLWLDRQRVGRKRFAEYSIRSRGSCAELHRR